MAALRKKSCRSCVKTKRRCDLDFPSCQRCLTRGLKCVYPWAELGLPDESSAMNQLAVLDRTTSCLSKSNNTFDVGGFDSTWLDTAVMDETAFLCLNPPASIPKQLSPAMLVLLEGIVSYNGLSSPSSTALTTQTQSSILVSPEFDVPWDTGPITTGSHFQPRCEYGARRFAAQPAVLAEQGHTTFIHHSQVQSSPVLQDALSASALHAMRNPSNNGTVKGFVAQKATILIEAVDAVVRHAPGTLDILPPVQALVVYQCIRLFGSNDISQQSQAERDGERLRDWLQILRRHLRLSHDSTDWKAWVRHESIRRTVLFGEMLFALHQFLKEGWDRADTRLATLKYTAPAPFWEAKSAAEWKRACQSPIVQVRMSKFDEDLKLVSPDDAEEMTVIIKAIHSGLDDLEEWLGGERDTLKRWGLRP